MDFKNILNQLDKINVDVKKTRSSPTRSSEAPKQTLTESVSVSTKSSRPSLKDVFNRLMEGDITLEPAKPGAMAIKSGNATIGTAHTPQAANQMKQAIEKGEITMGGDDEMTEDGRDDIRRDGADFAYDPTGEVDIKGDADVLNTAEAEAYANKLLKQAVNVSTQDKGEPRSSAEHFANVKFVPGEEHFVTLHTSGRGGPLDSIDIEIQPISEFSSYGDISSLLAIIDSEGFINTRYPDLENAAKAFDELETLDIGELTNFQQMNESKSPSQIAKDKAKDKADVKRDDKAEKAGKEVAKDAKYDGRKHPGKDGKEVAKDIEYDEWKEKKLPSISRIKKMCKDGLNQTEILKLHSMCDKQKLKDMIKKCKTNLKEGVDHILKAAKHMGKSHGLCKGGYACPHETGSEGHRAYHEGYKEGLDECMGIRNEPVLGMVDETEGKVVDTMASYGAMGEDETYEGNAFSGALAKTAKGSDFTVGGNTYTKTTEAEDDAGTYDKYDWNASTEGDEDDAWTFESLDAELDSLLNEDKVEEGVNISVQSGMEGQEDRVSVNATDAEADKLIQFVKSVGLGIYGDEEVEAEVVDPSEVSFYGSEAPSEEPANSHDDMLKLMGIVDMGDEGEEDFADEEASDSVDVQVVDGDSEEEMCEACGSKMTTEGCGCSKTDEGAQYGPDDGSHNSNNDMQGNADANASLAANDADTPQLVKEKEKNPDGHHHTSNEPFIDPDGPHDEEDDHAGKVKNPDGYHHTSNEPFIDPEGPQDEADDRKEHDDKEDKSEYSDDWKRLQKEHPAMGNKSDWSKTDEDSHLKEMMSMLSEVGSEASEEPTQPLSQHDDDNLTTEGAEDAPADDLDGSVEPVTETQTEDQKEFAVAESEENDLEEGKIPAGLKAYQDKKKGKKDDSEKDVKEEEEELTEWANDAGKKGTDTSFEQDIDFMTKVISGGLNKQKSTGQTTIPVIAGQNDRTGYNGADLVKEGSVMSHDGLANLMNRLDYLSK